MNAEKLMKTIAAVEVPDLYCVYPHELMIIYEANNGKEFNTAVDAFRYGFLKGQRAARAEDKRKAKERYRREMEKHAPGYCLLMTLIERNMSNERFVGKMITRANIMEKLLNEEATPND